MRRVQASGDRVQFSFAFAGGLPFEDVQAIPERPGCPRNDDQTDGRPVLRPLPECLAAASRGERLSEAEKARWSIAQAPSDRVGSATINDRKDGRPVAPPKTGLQAVES